MADEGPGDLRWQEGNALLAGLAAAGVESLASFWYLTAEAEEWRLSIVSTQVENLGPKKLLRLAYELLRKMDKTPFFTFFDIEFKSPYSADVMELMRRLGNPNGYELHYSNVSTGEGRVIIELKAYVINGRKIVGLNSSERTLAAE